MNTRAMSTKLTLTIEDTVIDSAKKYARQKGKSLSDIAENYLKSISASEESVQTLSPRVAKLMGSVKLPEDFDYKKRAGQGFDGETRVSMKQVFMDTNIVIDFLANRQPFAMDAAKLFDLAVNGKVRIFIAAVSYNNIYKTEGKTHPSFLRGWDVSD